MPLWEPEPAPGRYGALLLLLIAGYLLSAFIDERWIGALQVVLFTVVMVLALRSSSVSRRAVRVLLVVAGIGVANIWTGLVLLVVVAMIVHRVLAFGTVTLQSIFGAFSAYLIVGLMFASFYAAMYHFGGDQFFANG